MSYTRPDRWPRVEAALEAALAARPEEWEEILARVCDGDPELRREVESLLAAHTSAGEFLETPVESFAAPFLDDSPEADPTGSVVGRYRLIEEIGRGGMGTVWLAERADGHFEQRVALKLVKRGMDTDEILARFLHERQILARLEHPNIARLLDGGVSDDGRPYFVMEHVAGLPITEHCDHRELSIDQRLGLFAIVCRAVQHAHRSLVVHRDLKPSNVLVDQGGQVKLLDFGVAKLLEEDGSEAATMAGGRLMTPEYASPEQIAGGPVTTASDVYQLGLLLYELLTGHRPYRAIGRSRREVERAVLETDPQRPSTAIRRSVEIAHRDGPAETIEPGGVSARRNTSPERLRRRLRGDLDAITLRALRKEPNRRYLSADDLAEDVERHLAYLPIQSAGNQRRYRAAKFIRRHRIGVASAAVAIPLLVGMFSLYTIQIRSERDRAQREAAKASESAVLLRRFFQGWDPDAADRGEVSAEKVLGDAARRAELELAREPEMLAATLSVLGDLHTALGQHATADSLLGRALAIQEDLGNEATADLAATLARRGRLALQMGRHQEAESMLRRALAMHQTILGAERPETLAVQFDLGVAVWSLGRNAEAETILRDALAKSPDRDAPLTTEIASQLGYTLFDDARYEEAALILRPTLARQRRIFGRLHQSTLATTRYLAASLRAPEEMAEAEALDRDAHEIARALYGRDHDETGNSAMGLAVFLERKGDFVEAELYVREALAQSELSGDQGHPNRGHRLRTLGGLRLVQGDTRSAELLLRRALESLRRAYPEGTLDEGDVLNRLAWIVVTRGAHDAEALYREAVAFELARPAGAPFFITDGYEYLAAAARHQGNLATAEELYRRALGLYRVELPDGHPYRAQTAVGLGQTLLDTGRPAEAERYLREGLTQWQARTPPEPERVEDTRTLLIAARPRG